MSRNRTIALVVWVVVTAAVFVSAMAFLIVGDYFAEKHRIVMVSIAIAPVALVAAMVGYAVWWLVMFLLTFFLPEERQDEQH